MSDLQRLIDAVAILGGSIEIRTPVRGDDRRTMWEMEVQCEGWDRMCKLAELSYCVAEMRRSILARSAVLADTHAEVVRVFEDG